MRLSEWARRLGDFLGIEPEEDEHPTRASEEEQPAQPSGDESASAVTEPPAEPPQAAPRRQRRIVHGPGSDEELADLRSIVEELQEHVDADPDE